MRIAPRSASRSPLRWNIGLGFVHAAQELLPNADVGFIGVSRDEETFQPKPYVNKLPEHIAGRQCIVLDPMLATGGSLAHTCQLLLERGATGTIIVVCVLAAPEGIALLKAVGLHLAIYTAAVDEHRHAAAYRRQHFGQHLAFHPFRAQRRDGRGADGVAVEAGVEAAAAMARHLLGLDDAEERIGRHAAVFLGDQTAEITRFSQRVDEREPLDREQHDEDDQHRRAPRKVLKQRR